ncbi:MAG: BrxA/BrxB family bacilliredoxin [Acidobacteriota bacterium]
MPYDPRMTAPMRAELTQAGFQELRTADEVDQALSSAPGPVLLVVNSICGCAAGIARPGIIMSLSHPKAPATRTTVFAGQDMEATARARSYFGGNPPSSPEVAILEDGKLRFLLQRHEIEGRSAQEISARLSAAYEAS